MNVYGTRSNNMIKTYGLQGQASWSLVNKRAEDNLMIVRNLLERPIDENVAKTEQKAQVRNWPRLRC